MANIDLASSPEPAPTTNEAIAGQVRAAYQAFKVADAVLRRTPAYAERESRRRDLGHALLTAHRQLGITQGDRSGRWAAFLEKTKVPARTAQRYMDLVGGTSVKEPVLSEVPPDEATPSPRIEPSLEPVVLPMTKLTKNTLTKMIAKTLCDSLVVDADISAMASQVAAQFPLNVRECVAELLTRVVDELRARDEQPDGNDVDFVDDEAL